MSELDALRDRETVTEVVNNLFVAVDNRDWETARACFAERVLFDMSSAGGPAPSEVAAEDIVAGWEAGLAPIEVVHHQSGNFRVRVAVDEAECFCYGTAYHHRRVRSGNNTRMFVGSYDYRLRRAGDTWCITHFKFNSKFVDGNLRLESEEPA